MNKNNNSIADQYIRSFLKESFNENIGVVIDGRLNLGAAITQQQDQDHLDLKQAAEYLELSVPQLVDYENGQASDNIDSYRQILARLISLEN